MRGKIVIPGNTVNVADAVLPVQLLSSVILMMWLPLQAGGTFKLHVSSPVSDMGILLSMIWLSQWMVAKRPEKPLPLMCIDVLTVDARNINGRVTVKARNTNKTLECINSASSEDFIAKSVVYIALEKKSNLALKTDI
jgi:hypothetical protein